MSEENQKDTMPEVPQKTPFYKKNVPVWKLFMPFAFLLVIVAFTAGSCDSQTTATIDAAKAAAAKWGNLPAITNYYEYWQLKQVYQERDNPNVVLYEYLYSPVTGQLTCFGKVAGYGIPYSTEWSQPNGGGSQGSVPEPNGLYPSQGTNADWTRKISSDGKTHVEFTEPDVIITDQKYPCTPLRGELPN